MELCPTCKGDIITYHNTVGMPYKRCANFCVKCSGCTNFCDCSKRGECKYCPTVTANKTCDDCCRRCKGGCAWTCPECDNNCDTWCNCKIQCNFCENELYQHEFIHDEEFQIPEGGEHNMGKVPFCGQCGSWCNNCETLCTDPCPDCGPCDECNCESDEEASVSNEITPKLELGSKCADCSGSIITHYACLSAKKVDTGYGRWIACENQCVKCKKGCSSMCVCSKRRYNCKECKFCRTKILVSEEICSTCCFSCKGHCANICKVCLVNCDNKECKCEIQCHFCDTMIKHYDFVTDSDYQCYSGNHQGGSNLPQCLDCCGRWCWDNEGPCMKPCTTCGLPCDFECDCVCDTCGSVTKKGGCKCYDAALP